MKKFKILEEGRLSNSEMKKLVGGGNQPPSVCHDPLCFIPGVCDFEIKQTMSPGICRDMAISYGCHVFGSGGKTPGDNCYAVYGSTSPGITGGGPSRPSVCSNRTRYWEEALV